MWLMISRNFGSAIERTVSQYEDPAVRIATGVRLYLYKARAFPLFARFVVQAGLHLEFRPPPGEEVIRP
ncbi:hypothetical protein [Cupriavidus consociatus]|uniref:hypothetical protein n=1 Tax=Cupriavidus consociatus TaxID=2821357 RepID=UPI001AE97B18|nr:MULTISPECIES: hypothetical protein [unclassified Cupriavidus]MBP0624846.1 hypothetical protein [Cupriavidus sp. LEh25]MDK2661573.1 hypothetical protein [Cupriavidus sp. LEh21]